MTVWPEFIDPQGDRMVPLRCQACGEQIGLKSPGVDEAKDERIIALCYSCAAVGEAEAITESLQPIFPPERSPAELLYLRCVDVAFGIAKDITTVDSLLAGHPVDRDRLDPDGLAWALERRLVRLDVRAIELFDFEFDRPFGRLREMSLEEFAALFREAA